MLLEIQNKSFDTVYLDTSVINCFVRGNDKITNSKLSSCFDCHQLNISFFYAAAAAKLRKLPVDSSRCRLILLDAKKIFKILNIWY